MSQTGNLRDVLTRAWHDGVFCPCHVVLWSQGAVGHCYSVDPQVYYRPGKMLSPTRRKNAKRHKRAD